MQLIRGRKVVALVAAVVVAAGVWVTLPDAHAATNVTWFAGHVVVNNGANLDVVVNNTTNSPKTAIIFVRRFDGSLLSPVANSNTVSNIPADQATGRAYACAGGPCFFTVKVTTTSTKVVPSGNYINTAGEPSPIHTGDFSVHVVRR